jgi:hypothetical protein
MKNNQLKLKAMTVAILTVITGLFAPLTPEAQGGIVPKSTPSGPVVVYPTYPQSVAGIVKIASQQGERVVGEMTPMSDGDLIVIPTGESDYTALLLRITHENAFNIGDNLYMKARLRTYGSQGRTINTVFTLKTVTTGSTGLREGKGEGKLQVSISAWTTMYCITYQETVGGPWKTKISWGTGASANNAGQTLERSQLSTLPGTPVNYGIKTEIVLRNKVPTLYVTSDSEGTYILQESADLTSWTDVGATITPIPELGVWKMGVFYEFNMVEPDPPPPATENSPAPPTRTRFYRYVMR